MRSGGIKGNTCGLDEHSTCKTDSADMARGFDGNADRVREVSIRKVAKAMQLDIARWTGAEFHSLENWSLVLALIPDLSKWTPNEKRELVEIIRSQSGRNEMWYLRLTQRHARLRDWLLRLRSR